MDQAPIIDSVPLWALFTLTSALVLLCTEVGYRLGRRRFRNPSHEKEGPVGSAVGATLGLLAFMLAFTFGMAASQFDKRRTVVVEEANAIETAYLRAELLPKPTGPQIRKLLREYVNVRLQGAHPGKTMQAVAKSIEIQKDLWAQIAELEDKMPNSKPVELFTTALNDVIALHSIRVMLTLNGRIPGIVWLTLYLIAILSMIAMGYQMGVAGSQRSPAIFPLAMTFALVLYLVADLERPFAGILEVNQQPLVELRESFMQAESDL